MTTQPKTEPTSATFKLSEAELAVVCSTLDTDWLPGMSLDEDLADDEARLQPILAAGVRTLTERNILFEAKLDDEDVTRLDEVVQATVLVCAEPEHAVSILHQQTGEALHQSFFYRVPDLGVLHRPLGNNEHEFELAASTSAAIGLTEIQRVLSTLPDGQLSTSSYTVPQEVMAAATDLSHSDPAAAAKHLIDNGVSETDAMALAHTLSSLSNRILVQFQHAIDDDSPDTLAPQVVFTFLSNGEQVWSLESDDPDPDAFTLQRTTRATALAQVGTVFEPMLYLPQVN